MTIYNFSKEGRILFNDAHNTFYLQSYGVGHMVKDHSYILNPLIKVPARSYWYTYQKSGLSSGDRKLIGSEREEGVLSLYLPTQMNP